MATKIGRVQFKDIRQGKTFWWIEITVMPNGKRVASIPFRIAPMGRPTAVVVKNKKGVTNITFSMICDGLCNADGEVDKWESHHFGMFVNQLRPINFGHDRLMFISWRAANAFAKKYVAGKATYGEHMASIADANRNLQFDRDFDERHDPQRYDIITEPLLDLRSKVSPARQEMFEGNLRQIDRLFIGIDPAAPGSDMIQEIRLKQEYVYDPSKVNTTEKHYFARVAEKPALPEITMKPEYDFNPTILAHPPASQKRKLNPEIHSKDLLQYVDDNIHMRNEMKKKMFAEKRAKATMLISSHGGKGISVEILPDKEPGPTINVGHFPRPEIVADYNPRSLSGRGISPHQSAFEIVRLMNTRPLHVHDPLLVYDTTPQVTEQFDEYLKELIANNTGATVDVKQLAADVHEHLKNHQKNPEQMFIIDSMSEMTEAEKLKGYSWTTKITLPAGTPISDDVLKELPLLSSVKVTPVDEVIKELPDDDCAGDHSFQLAP